jgi:FtsP/CotA-like multicopper oxidase with cupredoxin domain
MKRRDFLRISAKAGLAAVALGGAGVPVIFKAHQAHAANQSLNLTVTHAFKEMVTGEFVDVWAYDFGANGGLRTPGTTIFVTEGDEVTINLTNDHVIPHSFMVQGVPDSLVTVNPGMTDSVTFTAPAGGTYMYGDPEGDPSDADNWLVSRVMGLAGVMVVLPASGNTPYSDPTNEVQQLFDDLGDAPHFPGNAWDPARTWIWVFNTVDPLKNGDAEAVANQLGIRLDPDTFQNGYLPQFFELSGKTGFFSSHDEQIAVWGNPGMPAVIRCLNTGLAWHSPHIHGNHVFEIFKDGEVSDNIFYLDTWGMPPGEIKDMLHPFIIPPDVVTWPPADVTHQLYDENQNPVFEADGVTPVMVTETQFPIQFPMHCHNEISQTAAGGNYPQGLVTHWMFLNPNTDDPIDPENIPFHPGQELFRDFSRAG